MILLIPMMIWIFHLSRVCGHARAVVVRLFCPSRRRGRVVPTYRIETAKSGRSKCKQKGKAKKCVAIAGGENGDADDAPADPAIIEKDAVRVGNMNEDTGEYYI